MSKKHKKISLLTNDIDLEFSPYYWIYQIHNQYIFKMDYFLKEIGLDNSRRQILLALKSKNNSSVTDLSKMIICKISTTTKIIQRLENEGFVQTINCKIDRRITRVLLNKKGEEAIKQINNAHNLIIKKTFNEISVVKIEKFLEILKQTFNNLST